MPKIGDRIEGVYASADNPQKFGTFIEVIQRTGRLNPGTFYRVTDGKGAFWMYPKDSCIVHPAEPMVPLRLVEEIEKAFGGFAKRGAWNDSENSVRLRAKLGAAIRAAREGAR